MTSMERPNPTVYRVAGHAVARVVLGRPFVAVSIAHTTAPGVPAPTVLPVGATHAVGVELTDEEQSAEWTQQEAGVLDLPVMVACAAGGVTERRSPRGDGRTSMIETHTRLGTIVGALARNRSMTPALWHGLLLAIETEADAIVTEHWRAIEDVVDDLSYKRMRVPFVDVQGYVSMRRGGRNR